MDFDKAIQALCDAEVEFVIIGGVCAGLHGSSYSTLDLDVCFSRRRENLKRLAVALAPFHLRLRDLPPDSRFVWDAASLGNGTVFTLDTDLGKIILLAEVNGVGTYEEARANAVLMPAFDREVWTLDLADLIKAKRAAGRPKDLALVAELEGLLDAQQPE
jgi:hypothetical protein